LDGDDDVDSADLTAFLLGWTGVLGPGEGSATRETGDLDGDGDVDSADMTEMLLNWTGARSDRGLAAGSNVVDAGRRAGGQVVLPEPGSAVLGGLGTLALGCFFRRKRKYVPVLFGGDTFRSDLAHGLRKECGPRPGR
jgi:hypothetical protein